MDVRITGRRGELTDDDKDYAISKIEPLSRFNRHARAVEVIFDEDNLLRSVEAIAHLAKGAPVVVHAKHEDLRAAIDLAHDRLERVLRRQKQRREARRHQRVPGQPVDAPYEDSDDLSDEEE